LVLRNAGEAIFWTIWAPANIFLTAIKFSEIVHYANQKLCFLWQQLKIIILATFTLLTSKNDDKVWLTLQC